MLLPVGGKEFRCHYNYNSPSDHMKFSKDFIFDALSRNIESLKISNSKALLINGWFKYRNGNIYKRNFGDELNIYLLNNLLPNRILVNLTDTCHWASKTVTNYIVIGSLIEEFTTPMSEIWGAGAIEGGKHPLRHKPKKVWAVRGELTRQYLLDHGVDCPPIYGDPALLMPLIYQPEKQAINEIGIIPHVSEIHHPQIQRLVNDGAKLIRLDKYDSWQSVIDKICSCKTILSSSLHGLIISDAYSIPNQWIAFSDNLLGGHFKFQDYFSAVKRKIERPVKIVTNSSLSNLFTMALEWNGIDFDPNPLLNSAPWEINIDRTKINNIHAYSKHNNSGI